MPPDEQTALFNWIKANVVPPAEPTWDKQGVMTMKVPKINKSNFGRWIAFAPLSMQAPYAIGDVERTYKLFQYLHPQVAITMQAPYDRERRLLPHLISAEKRGIRVDRMLLLHYHQQLSMALYDADYDIRAYLHAPGLNIDSSDDLADALDAQGLISHWETPQGVVFPVTGAVGVSAAEINPFTNGDAPADTTQFTRSMSKGALSRCCTDAWLVNILRYRGAADTMLNMFVKPWLRKTEGMADPRLHTTWHQVIGVDANGARTGRIASTDPNLANVPNPNETLPPSAKYAALPSLRKVLLPEIGHVWLSADYSQQELRLTAHYEDGVMQHAYRTNPQVDLHLFAQELVLQRTGRSVPRKHIKNIAFASIYGAGLPKLAMMMGVTEQEAEEIREAYFLALPGLRKLIQDIKVHVGRNGFIRSLGGRRLLVEPPSMEKGRIKTFDFKMPNKLIQGSAADMTKEAIVQFCENGGSNYFMSQVYDEINVSVPKETALQWAHHLVNCMVNALPIDVPILVDVEVGSSWGDLMEWKL
jgi:DNA polymerase I-like protein with 3'-5' exonuclease and polymerase domains